MKLLSLFLLCLILLSCSRAELKDMDHAYLPGPAPDLKDTLDLPSLRLALERDLQAFDKGSVPDRFVFGGRVLTREEYRLSLAALRPELESWDRFDAFVKENFDFFVVYGGKGQGEVLSTGYYDPVVDGSLTRTARFNRPLYRTPKDLVSVDLKAYAERNPGLAPLQNLVTAGHTPALRGRYVEASRKVVPYYLRAEIDGAAQALNGKGLELVYLDPVDAFFLEIQGSGIVNLGGGKRLRVGYEQENGAPYFAIGKALTGVIPLPEMSMQRIRAHLASLDAAGRDAVLFQNPSYVFFKRLEGEALTYSGAAATGGRTIATDKFLFPKGVFGYFEIEEPTFADPAAPNASGWELRPRFVFDQDTGGAIRGGGRVDLYMGEDAEAARKAGVMKREGRLWGLVPKPEFLAKLKAASVPAGASAQ